MDANRSTRPRRDAPQTTALARAHARSGDPAAITGYSGKSEVLDDAIASFAMAYAKQTILDHAALVKAKDPATSAKTITVRTAKAA